MPPLRSSRPASGSRRVRNTCERCRALKVRCYFGTGTSKSCIRCVQCDVQCSGRDSGRDDLGNPKSGQNLEKTNIIKELMEKKEAFEKIGSSPLKRAIALEAYSLEEVEEMYGYFKSSNMSLLLDLYQWDSIMDVDAKSPQVAIAIVSVTALTKFSVEPEKHQKREFCLSQIWKKAGSENSLDICLALAIVCAYRLPYAEVGVSHLFFLHGVFTAVINMTNLRAEDLALLKRTHLLVTVPYTFLDPFRPTIGLISIDQSWSDKDGSITSTLLQSSIDFRKGIKGISTAKDIDGAVECYEDSMSSIFMSHAYDYEITALHSVYFLAKIKLMKAMAVRVCTSSKPEKLAKYRQKFLSRLIAETNVLGLDLARGFAQVSRYSLFPSFSMYLVEEILVNFFAMRFISFAAQVDVDVRTEDFLRAIDYMWVDAAQNSSTARQGYVSLAMARMLSGLKVGVLNKINGLVEGSGKIPYFEIYIEVPETNTLALAGSCTNAEAHEILCSIASGSEIHWPVNSSEFEYSDVARSFVKEMLRIYIH